MNSKAARRRVAWALALFISAEHFPAQDVAPLPPPVTETPALLPLSQPKAAVEPVAAPRGVESASPAAKPPSSTSASGQFIVYGDDLTVRGAFCILCDETAQALGRVLKDNARFSLPIIVVLKTPSGSDAPVPAGTPATTVSISELTHGGFHLQINAQLRPGFRSEDFSRELVRVLLAERILRDHKRLSTARQGGVLPDWVMTGVTQAVEFRSRAKPSVLFAAVFRRGQVYSLDRILSANVTQLDALSRGIYETSTCALVLTLLDQPDGPVRFSKFLGALATDTKNDRELLAQHFPTLATSKNALEKWWSLQMATLATPTAMETLSIADTESQLDDALTLVVPSTKAEPAPPTPTMPPVLSDAAAPEKKPGGILGWLTREKEPAKAPEPPAPVIPAVPAPPLPAEGAKPAETTAPEPAKESGRFRLPGFLNPFDGGKKIAFPFPKSRKDDADAAKGEASKADAPPPANPGKPNDAPAVANDGQPMPSLPAKPQGTRSIGGQPQDLPPTAPAAAPTPETVPAEAKKPSPYNPLNWFRKDKSEEPAPVESQPDGKTAPAPEVRKRKPGSLPLEDFALLAKHPDRKIILLRCVERLHGLKLRAHPLYRPLIADYADLVHQMAEGKDKGVTAKLEALRVQRQKVRALAESVESHLDWYEANHTTSLSHAFDDFLKLDEQLKKERMPRNDAISKYLDAMEKEFQE